MQSRDGNIVVTYNGEIYNFWEERKALEAKGYRFRSRCDTEVLLALYEEYGIGCLEHLRGMFAFAIYDKVRRRIFCARDRMGEKPFKYFFNGRAFVFASELKALLRYPECPKEIDREAIYHFLTMMYLPSPLTGFRGISKLEPAHYLLLDLGTGKLQKERYWSLDYSKEEERMEKEWCEMIRGKLEESVKMRMLSDVPIAAFLSGGVDSSAVVTLMTRNSSSPVQTFSIGSRTASHNELPDAERIARYVGSDHHPEVVDPDVIALLPELVGMYEEPFADPSCIPTFFVSKHTGSFVKVALTGDGGDENFAGYVRYPILRFSRVWERFQCLHPLTGLLTSLLHTSLRNTFSYRCHRFQSTMSLPWPERYLQYISVFTEEEKKGLGFRPAGSRFGRTDRFYAECTKEARERARDTLHKALAMDVATYLADDLMSKVDLAAMHFGLECRAPFLDHELLEMTARIPARLKLRGREGKVILKRAFEGILPADTLKKRKQGFRIPLDAWFRTDLKEFITDTLLSDAPHKWEFFDRAQLERSLAQYFATHVDYSDHIWVLLCLHLWLSRYHR
jgi:asparagine synthase (glutamine-hydrolysing)